MRPWLSSRKNWITATGIVLLEVKDNTEDATLNAHRYLSGRLNEKKIEELIKKAFLKLKYRAPGLKGKERLFIRPRSEHLSWRQRLGLTAFKGAVQAAVSAVIEAITSSF
jgi:hypothetical protein